VIAACVKWVAGMPEPGDDRFAGISLADQAALECALRQAATMDDSVCVVTVGPPAAERALRDAIACGAARAVRLHLADEQMKHVDSARVATMLATVLADAGSVWCGDYSGDRGTGSVPAFLAAFLSAAQALGVVEVNDLGDWLRVTRRLDGGRRELLRLDGPAVVSVEGAVARLRRAGLPALMAARTAAVEVLAADTPDERHPPVVQPYRPRARALAAPGGPTVLDRLRELTEATAAPARGETVHLEPAAAAAHIVAALRGWGYLDELPS
jgi:electron transfer flavoprotein beta subunit